MLQSQWWYRGNICVEFGWEKARGILLETTMEGKQTKTPNISRASIVWKDKKASPNGGNKNRKLWPHNLKTGQIYKLTLFPTFNMFMSPLQSNSKRFISHGFKTSLEFKRLYSRCVKRFFSKTTCHLGACMYLHGGPENAKETLENLPLRLEHGMQSHCYCCSGPLLEPC